MFNNIIGNDNNKEILNNCIEKQSISHSYIFSGISGIGKFLFAKEFAKAICCLDENEKPCNNCKNCESFNHDNNPDIIIIDEQNESIKTAIIKDLTNNVLEKPIQCSKKIYIINNSENMTKEAQNSILKTLEEPPEYAVIILVTSNENLLLNTIKSRCVKLAFSKLSDNEIECYFNSLSVEVSNTIIKACNGSIETALRLIDKKDIYENLEEVFQNIENVNELEILKIKDTVFKDKEDIFYILDYINTIFYQKALRNPENVCKYQKCINAIEEAKTRIKRNSNYDMTLDNCLLKIEGSLEK